MTLTITRLHLIVFLLFGSLASQAQQQEDAKYLQGFDETQEISNAKKDGVADLQMKQFIEKRKLQFIQRKKADSYPVDPYLFSQHTGSDQKVYSTYCPNSGFDQNNFTNWTGGYFTNSSSIGWTTVPAPWIGTTNWNTFSAGTVNAAVNTAAALQTVVTTPAGTTNPGPGWDPNAISTVTGKSEIPLVFPGGSGASVRLGNSDGGGETERLTYTMVVSPQNQRFTYSFAVVLNDGGSTHTSAQQPFFRVTVKNQFDSLVGGSCGQYQVDATLAATDTSFHLSAITNGSTTNDPVYYRKWQSVTVDLSSQIGNTVTIDFQAADCIYTVHYGYAYIYAECGELDNIIVSGLCQGSQNVQLVAPTGFVNYQWQGPNNHINITGATNDTLPIVNPVVGDTFRVVMINASGCQTTAQVILDSSRIGVQSITANPSCNSGHSGSASIVPTGGVPAGYNYVWTTGPNQTGTTVGTTQTVNNLQWGTYYIHITSASCPDKDTFVVITQLNITPQSQTKTFCMSTANIAAAAGTNYQWYDNSLAIVPAGSGGNATPLHLTNAVNGQSYTVTYMNTSGCKDSVKFTLQQQNANFTPALTPTCYGGSTGSITLTNLVAAYAPFNYTWSNGGTINGASTSAIANPAISPLPWGTYTVNVVSTIDPACTYTVSVNILSGTAPAPVIDSMYLCPQANGNLAPPSNLSPNHHWYSQPLGQTGTAVTNLGILTSPLPVSPSNGLNVQGILYIDSVTTAQGCKFVYKTHINLNSIAVSTTSPIVINNPCYHDTLGSVSASILNTVVPTGAGLTYTWTGPFVAGTTPTPYTTSNPPVFPNTVMIDSLRAGTYVLTVTSGGCTATVTAVVTEPPAPNDTLPVKAEFCHRDSAGVLYAVPGLSNYQWYSISYNNGIKTETLITGATNDTLIIPNPESTYTNYAVTYYINGCRRHDAIIVEITPVPKFSPSVTVNVFTPNNDGKNDKFMPFYDPLVSQTGIEYYADEFSIKIYDRWGLLVYETTDYAKGWDGKHNGKDLDDGNYFWISTYKPRCGNSGDVVNKQGFVQLLR